MMKVAIVGSRGLCVEDFSPYLPADTTEIISGGAKGIDQCAAAYARAHGLILTECKPDYARYRRGAPLKRNLEIIDRADYVPIFWDGVSRGSQYVIRTCEQNGKPHGVIRLPLM